MGVPAAHPAWKREGEAGGGGVRGGVRERPRVGGASSAGQSSGGPPVHRLLQASIKVLGERAQEGRREKM